MQITLSPEQTKVLEILRQCGRYPSLENAIDTALLLLADEVSLQESEENPEYLAWVEQTRQKIEVALEQSQRGETENVEEVMTRLRNKVRSRSVSQREATR